MAAARWTSAFWAVVLLAGCDAKLAEDKQNPDTLPAEASTEPPTVARDGPNWRYSPWARDLPVATSAQWGMLPHATDYGRFAVGIIRRNGGNAIQVLCNRIRMTVNIFVWPRELSDPKDKPRELTVTFAGGASARQDWLVTPAGFGLWDNDAGFNDVIHGLSENRSVTLAVRGSGPEAEQDTISLAGAKAAIDLVRHACSNAD
jgi:hypothetical protein